MSVLTDMLQALLRSAEADTVAVSIGGTVYEVSVGDLSTVVIECIDTRYAAVLAQPATTRWEVRPVGADKATFTVSSGELMHALPAYTKAIPEPIQTVDMVVNADKLNVRPVPSPDNNVPLTQFVRGTAVTVKVSTTVWKQIVKPDDYKNAWVHRDYLKVPNP